MVCFDNTIKNILANRLSPNKQAASLPEDKREAAWIYSITNRLVIFAMY